MYADITGPITEHAAISEAECLFDEPVTNLTSDLLARGWNLITRAPGRMFGVSAAYGCTSTKTNIQDVITEAKDLTEFCEWARQNRD